MKNQKSKIPLAICLALLLAATPALAANKRKVLKPRTTAASASLAKQQRERIDLLELKVQRLEQAMRLDGSGGGEARYPARNLPPITWP